LKIRQRRKSALQLKKNGQRMAAWALNTKERFFRQDIHDNRNFFGTFSFIQSILLIMSNKRLNGAKLFLWTTLQSNVHGKTGGIQYARNKLAGISPTFDLNIAYGGR
jgi:hypothetical protein